MTVPEELLDRLAAFEATTLPVLSLYLDTSSDRHGRDDFEAFLRKALIAEHSLHVADRPHLYPLARLTDQHPLYAAVVADTNAARLFVFGRGVTLRTDAVQGTKVSRSSATEQTVQGAR